MIRGVLVQLKKIYRWFKWNVFNSQKREIDVLYSFLYNLMHDKESAIDLAVFQTQDSFYKEWEKYSDGEYLLSDPWFKENVGRIIAEEEVQMKPEWFKGKEVLDAGCGNGRWSYGLADLGANLTAVDVNINSIEITKKEIEKFPVKKDFYQTPLEYLDQQIPEKKFDLVFSWGVIHHCQSFNKAFEQVIKRVKEDGVLFLYLYSNETSAPKAELERFKEIIRYNTLSTEAEKVKFLKKKARGNMSRMNAIHDLYSPLIRRRLDYDYVHDLLEKAGFEDINRNKKNTEIYIRAIKSNSKEYYKNWILPEKEAPFWFQHHRTLTQKVLDVR
jgi:2-polyprenyl-3-methyl-5-hydroxy-6-metoxy-1,4-benzoquinol methylase